ncbi:MAG: hypothetical protein QG670_2655 [Thermoproteota archaeon]|nr:hypothetical protein [Thermoproteota archaeon]
MHFYVTLTLNCNMHCKYCYGKCLDDFGQPFPFEVDDKLPTSITYNLSDLTGFLKQDVEPSVIFYGGEPLLALDKIREIMDNVQVKAFVMQTNGLLLDRLGEKYCRKLDTVLISLDGNENLTDYYRGPGTYRKIIDNLKLLRNRGFDGELIARMTVESETNIREAVRWLLFNKEFPFKSVHWQLDAQFWQNDYESKRIQRWFERYNRGIRDLVKDWISHMEATGNVLRIYPFIGVMESLLSGKSTKLRCGAGWVEFNIQTDGNITPCPVMAGMRKFYLGNIHETNPRNLIDAALVGYPCPKCSIYSTCGGRCLYANTTKLWGDEGYRLVCGTVENLINSLIEVLPKVHQMIHEYSVKREAFNYPKYNSCEIIP